MPAEEKAPAPNASLAEKRAWVDSRRLEFLLSVIDLSDAIFRSTEAEEAEHLPNLDPSREAEVRKQCDAVLKEHGVEGLQAEMVRNVHESVIDEARAFQSVLRRSR